MTRLFYCFLALMLSLNITSCATAVKNQKGVTQGIESHTPPEGMGTVYLYRNQYVGSAGGLEWRVNNKKKGYLLGYSHLRMDVPKGSHKINTKCATEPPELTIEVEAGEKYFVHHQIINLISCSLLLVPQEVALKEISQTKPEKPIVLKDDDTQSAELDKQLVVSPEKSMIMIYNDSNIANDISISINKSPIAKLKSGDYLRLKVTPGLYEINSDGGTAKLKIEAQANQVHYVRQDVTLFGGRKLGLLPGTKLYRSDKESFTKFSGNLPDLYADIDFQAESPLFFIIRGGATYQGEFENDYPNGKGKILFPKGSDKLSYEGDVKHGRVTGVGTIVQKDGIIYTGDVEDGRCHGKGVVKFSDSTYEGDFVRNVLWGRGVYTFRDGSKYEGSVKRGLPDGKGKFTRIDKSSFAGEFKDGKLKDGISYSSTGQPLNNNQITSASSTSSAELVGFVKDLAFFSMRIVSAYYSGRTSNSLNSDMLDMGATNKRNSFDSNNPNSNIKIF